MPPVLNAPGPVPARQSWTTPGLLKAGLIVVWTLDVLFLGAALTGARVHRQATQTVGRDAASSIVAAQRIKADLADMDANAANELLGEPGKMGATVEAYEARRREAATAIGDAAESIDFGEGERAPIRTLLVGLGTYHGLVQRARDLHERGDARYLPAYLEAAHLVDEVLLPAADAVDKINRDALDRVYDRHRIQSLWARGGLLAAGLLLMLALATLQFFLAERTRRILNPALLAATFFTFAALVNGVEAFGEQSRDLRRAKQDAFESIHILWRACSTAYLARAEESRFLLDQPNADLHARIFQAAADEVTKRYLPDELKNITFSGEEEAARQAIGAFNRYLTVDQQLRQLAAEGKRKDADELATGSRSGQCNRVFGQFDQEIGKTIDINQREFDIAVRKAEAAMIYFEWKFAGAGAVVALLALAGLWKRLEEYR